MVADMTKHIIFCPETELPREECTCKACSEYRAALDELKRDREDEDERRREPSRRYDRDQWCRINGRCW